MLYYSVCLAIYTKNQSFLEFSLDQKKKKKHRLFFIMHYFSLSQYTIERNTKVHSFFPMSNLFFIHVSKLRVDGNENDLQFISQILTRISVEETKSSVDIQKCLR